MPPHLDSFHLLCVRSPAMPGLFFLLFSSALQASFAPVRFLLTGYIRNGKLYPYDILTEMP